MIKTQGLSEIYTVTIAEYFGLAEFCEIADVKAFNDYGEAIAYYNSIGGDTIEYLGGTHATKRIYRDKVEGHDVTTQVRIDRHPIVHE